MIEVTISYFIDQSQYQTKLPIRDCGTLIDTGSLSIEEALAPLIEQSRKDSSIQVSSIVKYLTEFDDEEM